MKPLRSIGSALASGAVIASLFAGCGGAAEERPAASGGPTAAAPSARPDAPGTVVMKDVKFLPERLTVEVGEQVTWRNDESLDHNVVAQKGARFRSRAFGRAGTYTFTPRRPGTIDYVCTLHPGMDGQIIVTGS